ncbi:duffy binding-like merozoite surface protein [Plasmodium gaboni]|uniref:Duffy binding-like merozoite surface protein n=1 Tax=Plasmodium gaboni TaxID=647221 RepID=A0A151L2D0_9APIC|nr:duffy binding-like merozoite surface protein [Plasmodium gaboni]KYN93100.1 duffy binding-like merozoite surface protein [Plasmodium gaboni]
MRTFNKISVYLFILHVLIFLISISCNIIINDNESNLNLSNIDNLKTEYNDDVLNVNKWENKELVYGNSEEVKEENKYYPSDVCENVGIFSQCPQKSYNSMNDWNYRTIKNSSEANTGVYVPPRRSKLCLLDLGKRKNGIKDMNKFKEELLKVASGESYSLMEYFKNEPSNAIVALDYSFSDLGDIVKGRDMMDNKYTRNINTRLHNIFSKQNGNNDIMRKRLEWWNQNKKDIWESMICGYSGKKKVGNFPELNNIDEVPQFFRWFREWGKDVCYEYEYNLYVVIKLCKIKKNLNNDNSNIDEMQKNDECIKGLNYYLEWINKRKPQWDYQSEMFNNNKSTYDNAKELTPQSYLQEKCIECNCKNKDLENTFKENKNKDEILKVLIQRSKDIQNEIMMAIESSTQIISNDFTNEDEHLGDIEEEEIYEDGEYIYGSTKREPSYIHSKPTVKKGKGELRRGESVNRADNWKLKSFLFPWTKVRIGIGNWFSRVTDPTYISQAAASAAENLVRSSAGIESGTATSREGDSSINGKKKEEEEEDDDDDDDDDEDEDEGKDQGEGKDKGEGEDEEGQKENMLKLINLTSLENDKIANENEDEKEEHEEEVEMYSSYVDEIEEEENITEEVNRDDNSDNDFTEDDDEAEEEETEEQETEKNQKDTEEGKNKVEEVNSKIDNEIDVLLSSHDKDNDKKKETHKSILNSVLTLFNKNDGSDTFLKGLRGDMTFFFQNI